MSSAVLVVTAGPSLAAFEQLTDGDFEWQNTSQINSTWGTEGPDPKGIDENGLQHNGTRNAWIRTASTNVWNGITQRIQVRPHTDYALVGWVRTSGNFDTGRFGVRGADNRTVIRETSFGPAASNPAFYQRLLVPVVNSGNNSELVLYIGFRSVGTDAWVQIDDLSFGSPYSPWAGFFVAPGPRNPSPITQVAANWVEPAGFPCDGTPARGVSMWVGIDGVDDPHGSLIQIGTMATCRHGNGNVLHSAFLEVIDSGVDNGLQTLPEIWVRPGDKIFASLFVKNPSASLRTYQLVIANDTTRQIGFYERTVTHSANETGEVVAESPQGGAHRWPTQFSIAFTGVTVNSRPIGDFDLSPTNAKGSEGQTFQPVIPAGSHVQQFAVSTWWR